MTPQIVLALLVFLFPLAYSPGPGNAFFAAIGAASGLRAAWPALAGYHVATFAVTAIVGLSAGATLLAHPVAAAALGVAGGAYVLWLAFGFVRAASMPAAAGARASVAAQRPGFWAGALVLILNPKAYSIIAAMFAQFLQPPLGGGALAVLGVTLLFTLNNLVAFIVWALGGRALARLFRTERAQRVINLVFAAMLAATALWMTGSLFP